MLGAFFFFFSKGFPGFPRPLEQTLLLITYLNYVVRRYAPQKQSGLQVVGSSRQLM